MSKRSAVNSGFTLLEVMVSIAILSISLMALMNMSGNTLAVSGRAEKVTIATMLASQRMVELEIELEKGRARNEFPEEKTEDGRFDEPYEDFSWKTEITRVELPAPVTGEKGSFQDVVGRQLTREISKTVRQIKLTVTWEELGEEQTLDVVTHIVKL